jgi:hypothetical protein
MLGPRVVFVAVVAAAGAVVAACGKGGERRVEVIAGKPAGVVREVAGTVTATRPGQPARALKVADAVSGDDVIETGAEGSVLIELDHNHVTFTLPAGKRQAVAASLAWNQPVATARVGTTDEHNAAAGRAIERSAVDTAASSMEPASAAPSPARPEPSEQDLEDRPKLRALAGGGAVEPTQDPPKPAPPPGAPPDKKRTEGLGDRDALEDRSERLVAPPSPPAPSAEAAAATAAPVFAIRLATRGPLTTADAAAKITLDALAPCLRAAQSLTMVVSAAGAITRVTAIDPTTTACVTRALASVTFAARKAATTITVEITTPGP